MVCHCRRLHPAELIIVIVLICTTTSAASSERYALLGTAGHREHERALKLQQQEPFVNLASYQNPSEYRRMNNGISDSERRPLSVVDRRSMEDNDLSPVLPPWKEFCQMLGLTRCRRYKRAIEHQPANQLHVPLQHNWPPTNIIP